MLDTYNEYGLDESAVMTLAEDLYEKGFPPDHAIRMAWAMALLPFETKDF